MGLFNRSDSVQALLKKLEADANIDAAELEAILDVIGKAADFHIEKHAWMFGHGSKKVREFAGQQLLKVRSQPLADSLLRELPGKPSTLRAELARLIVVVAPERVPARLPILVHSKDPADREAALELIEAHPRWQEFLGYLKACLKDPEARLRQRTGRLLARGIDNVTIFLLLKEYIHDQDDTLRHIIIEAFARKPNGEIVEPFFERITREGPELRAVMTRALSHLAKTSQSQIEERVLPMLGDEDVAVRDIAVKLLSEMPDRLRVLRAFLVHCRGVACWLRERSVQSLQKIQDSLLDSLLTLMRDPDHELRVNAMMLASGSKDPRLIPLVRDIFLSKADWWIRSIAAEVLGRNPSKDVTEILASQLEDPDLQYSVIHVLGKQGTPAAYEIILNCLRSPSRGVRSAAINSLRDTKTPEAFEIVVKAARGDAEASVREKAIEVLQCFGDMSLAVLKEIETADAKERQRLAAAPLELCMVNENLNR